MIAPKLTDSNMLNKIPLMEARKIVTMHMIREVALPKVMRVQPVWWTIGPIVQEWWA